MNKRNLIGTFFWLCGSIPGISFAVTGEPLPELNMHVFDKSNPPVVSISDNVAIVENQFEPQLHMVIFDDQQTQVSHPEAYEQDTEDFYPETGFSFEYYVKGGYRSDQIDWNIAGLNGSPNVLSELEWKDLDIVEVKTGLKIVTPQNWVVDGKFNYGWIVDGDNQDSDFFGDNRTLEFSRSDNDADDGHTLDISLATGYRFAFYQHSSKPWFQFTPLVGYSYHQQNLRITDGFQTIPAFGSFPGLDSSYETEWYGPWLGVDAQMSLGHRFDLLGEFEYHWIDFEAEADWNLRDDFQHPKSFTHDAEGEGFIASVTGRYNFNPHWSMNLSVDYQSWVADNDGIDKTFFADGQVFNTELNEVNWDSVGVNVGINFSY